MSFQQKPNSGALFRNEKKEKETHPDMRGDFNIDGVNYWINAWKKEGSRGSFISFSVEKKKAPDMASKVEEKPKQQKLHKPSVPPAPPVDDFGDSDIPFD